LDRPNASAAGPPRLESPPPTSPFNPYSRTEDTQPYSDYNPGVQSGKPDANPYSSPSQPTITPYEDRKVSDQAFQPLYPSQSYQDNYMKPQDSYSPYVERRDRNPSPPLLPQPKKRTFFSRLFNGDQKRAYFCLIVSIIQIGVFVGELIKNAAVMKTPIQIHPTFNPLIGPSSYVLPLHP
jgi:hypothetical protein